MAKVLSTLYPGKIDIDVNNPNGTFKNRTSDALKDGTPYEKGWASDIWGFVSHILAKAGISPNGAEENETNSQYYGALDGLLGRRDVKFETEDLIINVQSNTTVDADAKRVSLLDSNFIPKYINDLDLTFTMPTDLEAGTSEKVSTWYGMWVDSDENIRLVPDLESAADGTTAGKLIDSGATFLTDLVKAGDIVYNLTDRTQTTASADATAEGEIPLIDDIFVSGEDYKIVKMSPEGLGENRERIGAAYNNGSSDFDDSAYAQIQEPKTYNGTFTGGGGDFEIGATVTSVNKATATPRQVSEREWVLDVFLDVNSASVTSITFSISGIVSDTGYSDIPLSLNTSAVGGYLNVRASTAGNTIIALAYIARDNWQIQGAIPLLRKPTFHL